jgi:hypothetical protein
MKGIEKRLQDVNEAPWKSFHGASPFLISLRRLMTFLLAICGGDNRLNLLWRE